MLARHCPVALTFITSRTTLYTRIAALESAFRRGHAMFAERRPALIANIFSSWIIAAHLV
jgi:uncharacterized membrane protein YGL010W